MARLIIQEIIRPFISYNLSPNRYELMIECWKEDPTTRPSFSELIDKLEVIMTRDVPYCDLNNYNESNPYYNIPVQDTKGSG